MSALAAVLLVVQAMLVAWHGAALASQRIGSADAAGTVVICTAHGFMRVQADADGLPVEPSSGDPDGRPIKCPHCLMLSAATWVPAAEFDVPIPVRRAVAFVPWADAPAINAPRHAPRQRGPPSPV